MAIAIEVAHGDPVGAGSHRDGRIRRGGERAVAVAEQDGYGVVFFVYDRQIESAVAIQICSDEGGWTAAGSEWRIRRESEGSIAVAEINQNEALINIRGDGEIRFAIVVEIADHHRGNSIERIFRGRQGIESAISVTLFDVQIAESVR